MGMGSSAGGAGASFGDVSAGGSSTAAAAGGGGMDIMGMLGGLLKDPQVLGAIGNTASKLAQVQMASDKIPPHAKEMLQRAISQGIQQSQEPDRLNPYGGDMMRFITPDMARQVLDAHGIPYGRMNILS